MNFYQMAQIGICLSGLDDALPVGTYLQPFRITASQYESLLQRIRINVWREEMTVPSSAIQVGGAFFWKESEEAVLGVPYGRCPCAVSFAPADWEKEEITVRIHPQAYCERNVTQNQLLSVMGLHSLLLARGALTLHASYIRTKGGAVLFTAPSGTGKSTQAWLWHKYVGAEIINGDRAVVRQGEENWMSHGVSVCGSSDICKNESAPLRLLVELRQGRENRVIPLTAGEKYRALVLASAFYRWDFGEAERVHQLTAVLLEQVPMVRLVCRPDQEAVQALQLYMERMESA